MKGLIIVLLILFLLFVSGGRADEPGVTYLALPGYSRTLTAEAMRVFRGVDNLKLCTIWEAFGDRTENIKRFFETAPNKPHTLLLHLTNETCRRPPRHCTRFDTIYPQRGIDSFNRLAAAHPERIRLSLSRRVDRARTWANANAGDSTVIFSTGLEDNFTDETYRTILQTVRDGWYGKTSRNPMDTRGFKRDADFIELHGIKRYTREGGHIWSNDGNDLCETVLGRLDRNCMPGLLLPYPRRDSEANNNYIFFWWNNQGAGLAGTKYIEPRRRHFRLYRKDIDLVNELIRS